MKKILKILEIIVIILILLLLISTILHLIFTKYDKYKFSKYREYVEVNDKKMYISVIGQGKHTIVILPGLGCVGTVEYYRPLAKELAKTNKVIILEYFGYGFSDDTSKDRNIENIVSEIRECLEKLNITEKVILMPHSQSGLYSLYYAENYHNEIEAIIGLDMTLVEYDYDIDFNLLEKTLGISEEEYKNQYNKYPVILNYLVEKTGLMRLIEGFYNSETYKELKSYDLYSNEELEIYRKELKIYPSKALLNEGHNTPNMVKQMKNHKYSNYLSVLQFLNTNNQEIMPKYFGTDYIGLNKDMITNSSIQQYEIVDGKHSTIFLDGLDEIVKKQ